MGRAGAHRRPARPRDGGPRSRRGRRQDALAAATVAWARDGVPADPAPWIYVTARRRAIDRLRRARRLDFDATVERLAPEPVPESGLPDKRLELVIACCHPALTRDAQVALTLRALGGLWTDEIAAAFLVSPATMAQRLVRAKAKLRGAGMLFAAPAPDRLAERLDAVLAVVYLIFNEGYAATGGQARVRDALCDEAVRLGRLLATLLPDEPEALGLAALMLFHDSRRATRVDSGGAPIGLDEQDRARWDRHRIGEADGLLERALRLGAGGPYVVQACIASLHARAPHARDTDWPQIAALYRTLIAPRPGRPAELAYAVALGMAYGPAAWLRQLDVLRRYDDATPDERELTVRAELLQRAGHQAEAREAYGAAIRCSTNDRRRDFLACRLAGTMARAS